MAEKKKVVAVDVDPSLWAWFKEYAAQRRQSASSLLNDHLAELRRTVEARREKERAKAGERLKRAAETINLLKSDRQASEAERAFTAQERHELMHELATELIRLATVIAPDKVGDFAKHLEEAESGN